MKARFFPFFLVVAFLFCSASAFAAREPVDPLKALQETDPSGRPPAAKSPKGGGETQQEEGLPGKTGRKLIGWHWNLVDSNGKRVSRDVDGTTPYGRTSEFPDGYPTPAMWESEGLKVLNSNPIFSYDDGTVYGNTANPWQKEAKADPGNTSPDPGSGGTTPNPVTPDPPKTGEGGGIQLDVPQILQYNNCPPIAKAVANMSCGPTSLAMVLQYMGVKVTAPDLVGPTGCTSNGTWYAGITKAAKQYGLSGSWKSGKDYGWLKNQLQKGIPVLVATTEYGGHFMVVKGLDAKGNIIANDPADYSHKVHRVYPYDKFMGMWTDSFAT